MSSVTTSWRRLICGFVIASLIVSSSACATANEVGAPSVERGLAKCPDVFVEQAIPRVSRFGPIVPDAAIEALLCVYAFGNQGEPGRYGLEREVSIGAKDLTGLIDYLNALEPVEHSTATGCNFLGHDQYNVVFGYAGDNHALVRVDYSCGIVSSSGASRRLDRIDSLLSFWPDL